MAVSYRALGLVNSKDIFAKAVSGGYAIPGYNFSQMEQLQAVVSACVQTESPVILQISAGARKYANATILRYLAQGATEYAREIHPGHKLIPIVLHLDHGDSFDLCKSCIEHGFSSVMIDGSHLSYEENVSLTKRVCDFAHSQPDYVTVEGELGVLAGVEDDVKADHHTYTRPEEVEDFVHKTGVDSLAIAIGTSHGAYKFPKGTNPEIRLDILHQIEAKLPGFPIVLHGSSSIPQDYVDMVNEFGGSMPDAVGIPEGQLREAARSAVCKINIDSDGRIVMTGTIRKCFSEHPDWFDPRQYLGQARTNLTEMYVRKNREVLGSAGHAFDALPGAKATRSATKAATRPPPSATENLPADDPLIRSATEDMTQEQRADLRRYVREHPEIRTILQDFVANVLADKPDDTVAFAKEYFTSLNQ